MRLILRLREPLRAPVGGGAPVNLSSKGGPPPADVRLAAEQRQREAAEVGEGRVVTVADHPERGWGPVHGRVTRLVPQRLGALPEETRGQSLQTASAAWLLGLHRGRLLLGPGQRLLVLRAAGKEPISMIVEVGGERHQREHPPAGTASSLSLSLPPSLSPSVSLFFSLSI